VIGSSAVLDEGVSMPSRTCRVVIWSLIGESGMDATRRRVHPVSYQTGSLRL
jgi:hypothetical protein